MKCNQDGCGDDAAFRFTWPGKDEAGICKAHAPKLMGVAEAMGMYVQLIPLAALDTAGEPK
jgi:hypothetical protein